MSKELTYDTATPIEKALAISAPRKNFEREKTIEHLTELADLAKTQGAEIIETIVQERERPDKSFYIGSGKVEEIKLLIEEHGITMLLFDDDLSPAQARNLQKAMQVKIIDRSGLILDIFVSRARSQESKTQVELAQLQYLLPRLTRLWTHLSKQYGGIGSKGPGETQIETDRRMVKTRIGKLREKLDEIEGQRREQRKGREFYPRFALVGYTNAGKSTLMNAITGADVYVEDKLFATLDPTVRLFNLPSGEQAILSDTVGFIRKLPHHLVASFRSTLAEANEADFILHVVDASHEQYQDQIEVVDKTLIDIDITDKEVLLVFNKIDNIKDPHQLKFLMAQYPDALFISATKGINLNGLYEKFQELRDKTADYLYVKVPYENFEYVGLIYANSEPLEKKELNDGTYFKIKSEKAKIDLIKMRIEEFIIVREEYEAAAEE